MTQQITIPWADGEYSFKLAVGQLRELQEKLKIGVGGLLKRVLAGDYYVDDVREIMRLGLIGGGTAPLDALRLIENYVDARPLAENLQFASIVLYAAITGVQDDPVGKPQSTPTQMTMVE